MRLSPNRAWLAAERPANGHQQMGVGEMTGPQHGWVARREDVEDEKRQEADADQRDDGPEKTANDVAEHLGVWMASSPAGARVGPDDDEVLRLRPKQV